MSKTRDTGYLNNIIQYSSSSVSFVSGSTVLSSINTSGNTKYGITGSNTHQFTGSLSITGSLAVVTNGIEFQVNPTGVNLGNALTDSHIISGSLRVNPNGLFVSSSGNVGIGHTNPAYLLHLSRSSEPEIALQSSGAIFRTGINSSNEYFVFTSNAQPIYFATSGVERMRITSGGDVNITGSTLNLHNGYLRLRNSAGNATYGLFIQKASWIGSGTDYSPAIAAETGYGISFFTNGNSTERVRITTGGSLQVTGNDGSIYQKAESAGAAVYWDIRNSSDVRRAYIGFGGNSSSEFQFSNNENGGQAFITNGSERMRVTSGGNLLIGKNTTNMSANGCEFNGNGTATFSFTVSNNEAIIFNNIATSTTYEIDFRTNTIERGKISVTDSGTTYSTTSDYRVKEDFKDFNGLEKLTNIKVYDFKFKDLDERMEGVIAHELQEVIPYAVTGEKDGDKFQSVDYSRIVPVLIKSLQELKAENDTLKEILQRNNIQ